MDGTTIIEIYGLPGVMIVGLGLAVLRLWARLNEVSDARLADHKDHMAQFMENSRTLDKALEVVGRKRDV